MGHSLDRIAWCIICRAAYLEPQVRGCFDRAPPERLPGSLKVHGGCHHVLCGAAQQTGSRGPGARRWRRTRRAAMLLRPTYMTAHK